MEKNEKNNYVGYACNWEGCAVPEYEVKQNTKFKHTTSPMSKSQKKLNIYKHQLPLASRNRKWYYFFGSMLKCMGKL